MPTLRNATTGEIIAANVTRANSLLPRALGLLPRAQVAADDGLWFDNCWAIHTVGMRASIDVIFLDRSKKVIKVLSSVPSFQFAVVCLRAKTVIELGEGALIGRDVLIGDRLSLE
ncbi:MAG: DUF192 domain-containing protein [Candidatus Eremiobacteraeota bacterium]|nr:DUF192 domain-containing protein [Candidatus Eremiobacteraeota bacterium]